MSEILRTLLALVLLFSALLWWFGDFNEYVTIDGREYVDSRPPTAIRLANSVCLGALAALTVGAALLAVGRVPPSRCRAGFLSLAIPFSTLLFFFGDLNIYVVGYGPGGRDWVKGRSPWGVPRFVECAALGSLVALLSLPLVWVISRRIAAPGKSPEEACNKPPGVKAE